MRRTPLMSALLALTMVLALTACGGDGDDSPDDVRADLSEEIQEQLDLDEEQAGCFAGVLVEEIGADELQDVDFTAQEPPEGMEDDFTAAALTAIDDCDIDVSALGG